MATDEVTAERLADEEIPLPHRALWAALWDGGTVLLPPLESRWRDGEHGVLRLEVLLVLEAWQEHGKRLAAIGQERVNRLRDQRRLSWAAIGAMLKRRNGKGVSGARAQQIATGQSGYTVAKRKEEAKRAAQEQPET
ncbi:hypothetical protein [Streptomyces cadmiisoli]|uniref:hypothetical protein n=1 Tax=Streptomyces cadmiisoli TaxID=2184053 RepID=UPI003655866D